MPIINPDDVPEIPEVYALARSSTWKRGGWQLHKVMRLEGRLVSIKTVTRLCPSKGSALLYLPQGALLISGTFEEVLEHPLSLARPLEAA